MPVNKKAQGVSLGSLKRIVYRWLYTLAVNVRLL